MPFFQLLFATTNDHKLSELKDLVIKLPVKILSINDIPGLSQIKVEESSLTFKDNSELKAISYGRLAGIPTIADDSGLCVDILNGEPGVYSARYDKTPDLRIKKVLSKLSGIETLKRTAHFESAISIFNPSSEKIQTFIGRCDGYITTEPLGNGGFGYDPIFFSSDLGITFGQASAAQKNQVSHRAKAFEKLYKVIKKMA